MLKTLLTITTILLFPIERMDFIIFCDSSCSALGAMLMYHKIVIVDDSRKLNPHEKNNPTHELELASMLFVFQLWRRYLYVCQV